MICELRTYTCVAGRLPALVNRFDTVTLKLFDKHGIKPLGFFTTVIGPSNHTLTYMIAWPSMADRERIWPTFLEDPEWLAARAESERDGPLVENITNQLLQPTTFSAIQ